MHSESKRFWILFVLLLAVILSCYPLSFKIQDGPMRSGAGDEQENATPLSDQEAEDHAVENELDLYALPFAELLEIQVAAESSLDLYSLPFEELLEIQVASVI